MNYKPRWLRIIFLSIIFHAIFLSAIFFILSDEKSEKNLIQEIEWIDADIAENFSSSEESETFAETEKISETFNFPEIKIPATPESVEENFQPVTPVSPPVKISPKNSDVEIKKIPSKKNNSEEKKSDEDTNEKLKVFVKIFPKDIVNQMIESGILKEKPIFSGEKIILEVTVGKGGNVEKVSIIEGGSNEINILAENAASGWVFVPFLDENGKATETKTKIEFKSEDFR